MKILIEADFLANSLPLISDERLKEAQKIIDKIYLADSAQRWNDLNIAYYNCLYSGIKRPQTEEMINILRTKIERFNHVNFSRINKTKQYQSIGKLLGYCIDRKVNQAVEQLKQHFGDSRDEIKILIKDASLS